MAADIAAAVEQNSVVVVRGNTGCGKTTQVPQFLLDYSISKGYGASCNIVVTQVRLLSFFWELLQYLCGKVWSIFSGKHITCAMWVVEKQGRMSKYINSS